MNTDGEFRHVRMKLDTDMHKRASKVDRDKNESGWMAEIKGITHDSPRKLRGFRVNSIYFEECFAPNTKVIMSDYSRKRIEDIKVGDFVMGIDGTPQEVIKTNSGYDDLCIVRQLEGEDYIVTANHKLYVERQSRIENQKSSIELLTPIDYFLLSNRNKKIIYGLKSSIDYESSNPLSTPIKIENYKYGKYCGITLKSYGKDTDNLFLLNDYTIVHNCGSDPVLEKTYIQAEALVKVGGKRIGSRFLQGTGGDSGESLAALNKMFYDPEGYKILPYKNTYGRDQQVQYTGYFIPAYTMWFGDDDGNIGFDERGVVNEEMAKIHFNKEFEKYKDPHAALLSKAEYCFTPEDAFILEGSNRFDQELLIDQYNALTLHKTIELPKSVRLSWNIDKESGTANKSSKPRIEFISEGPLKITELPMEDPTGHAYSNLYVAGIDAIDTDSSTSTGQTDVSNFCMVVMRRAFGTQPPKIVAIYKERPTHIQTAFETALKLCTLYNCRVLVEATRISIKQYFEKEHKLDFLMRRPQSTANSTKRTNFKQYGVPATEAIIQHQLDLIEQFIVDYSEQIQFPEMLQELMKYSYENKRKFDIVAAFGICLLADEDLIGKVARPSDFAVTTLNFGYTKNKYGQIGLNYQSSENEYRKTNIGTNQMFISANIYQPSGSNTFGGRLYP